MRMIKNLIKRALITLSRNDQFGQCSYLDKTDSYQVVYPWGLYAIPEISNKPLIILLNVNGDESNKVGIEHNPLDYPQGLSTGDVILYNPVSKAQIFLKNDGKIAIGNTTTELLDEISNIVSECKDMADACAVHTHTSASPGNPSSVPNNAALFTTISGNLTAIKTLIDALKTTIIS